jgi:hypothetical protein
MKPERSRVDGGRLEADESPPDERLILLRFLTANA